MFHTSTTLLLDLVILPLVFSSAMAQPTSPSWATSHRVVPSCEAAAPSCSFDLHVEYVVTMAHPHLQNGTARVSPVFINEDGTAVRRERPGCEKEVPLSREELLQSNIADGTRKIAKGVNGHFPGPPIVVYQGQEVIAKVTNDMDGEATTMHWHGQRMLGAPYMDGAGGISQCSIDSGQSFTYRFIATNVGTHWYHSHHGFQRSEGVFGAFIVLPRPAQLATPQPTVTTYDDEFYMIVQDFYHQSTLEVNLQWIRDIGLSTSHSAYEDCYIGRTPKFVSALVNGKGRWYPDNGVVADNPGVPLEKYEVETAKTYRFRVINAGLETSLKLSVDHHVLRVLATDGNDVQPMEVDYLIVAAGERYDFTVDTSAEPTEGLGSYYIRLEGMAKPYNGLQTDENANGHTEAILHYAGGEDTDHPLSTRRQCTPEQPCTILNCPQDIDSPAILNEYCVPITELQGVGAPSLWVEGAPVTEYFFNMRFTNGTRADSIFKATINGIKNVSPSTPPMTYPPYDFRDRPCELEDCTGEVCACNHVVDMPLGHNIQITLYVQGPTFTAPLATHPIHLHGYHFEVVKMGFPSFDNQTGGVVAPNVDLLCRDHYCNNVTWANPDWDNGNLPNTKAFPPVKDTVAVPAGGYVVLRFRSDNPGYWYMHCHMEYHNHDGMALTFRAGEVEAMPPLPADFPRCGSFDFSRAEFSQIFSLPNVTMLQAATEDAAASNALNATAKDDWINSPDFLYAMIITLACVSVLLGGACLLLVGQHHLMKRRGGGGGGGVTTQYVFVGDGDHDDCEDDSVKDAIESTRLLNSL